MEVDGKLNAVVVKVYSNRRSCGVCVLKRGAGVSFCIPSKSVARKLRDKLTVALRSMR